MRRTSTIWILYAVIILTVFFCSSCSTARPKYIASKEVPVIRDNKKQKTNAELHICILMMTGFMFHFLNEGSD